MRLPITIPLLQILGLLPPPLGRLDTSGLDMHFVDGEVFGEVVEGVGEEVGAFGEEVRDGGGAVEGFEVHEDGEAC